MLKKKKNNSVNCERRENINFVESPLRRNINSQIRTNDSAIISFTKDISKQEIEKTRYFGLSFEK